MNHYWEQFQQIAKDFGLERSGYVCSLPEIHPSDCIMKYNGQRHRIYCADYLRYAGGSVCCFGLTELRPKQARERVAELLVQYKNCLQKRRICKMNEDF